MALWLIARVAQVFCSRRRRRQLRVLDPSRGSSLSREPYLATFEGGSPIGGENNMKKRVARLAESKQLKYRRMNLQAEADVTPSFPLKDGKLDKQAA